MCPACDPARQLAEAFNQPLSWDIPRVTDMNGMFQVRCAPRALPSNLQSYPHRPRTRRLCTAIAPRVPAGGGSRVAPHTPSALLATRQNAYSLSAANKLRIRCAWAGNPEFNRRYDSNWAPGSCD